MFEQELLEEQFIVADQIVKYKAYVANAPIFHINEVNSILLEMVNDTKDKENLSFIKDALMRFNFYSQLKQGEGPND